MKVTAIPLKTQLRQIKRELFNAQKERGMHIGKRMAVIVESLLIQTTRHWNSSKENKYPKPEAKVERKLRVNFTSGIIKIDLLITMIDNRTGKAHFIWHILSQGRRTYTFPQGKKSPPIKARNRRRTKRKTLNVKPFGGFSGEVFVIHGGQKVRAVPANEWYEVAAKEAMVIFMKDDEIKHWIPSFAIHPMKRG